MKSGRGRAIVGSRPIGLAMDRGERIEDPQCEITRRGEHMFKLWLPMLYIASVPLDVFATPISLSPTTIIGIPLVLTAVLHMLLRRKIQFSNDRLVVAAYLLVAWLLFAALFSDGRLLPILSLVYSLAQFGSLVVLLGSVSHRILVPYLVSAVGVAASLLLVNATTTKGLRLSLGNADENVLSLVLSVAVAISLYFVVRCSWVVFPLLVVALTLLTLAVLGTGSRTGVICLFLTFVVSIGTGLRRSIFKSVLVAGWGGLALFLGSSWDRLPVRFDDFVTFETLAASGGRTDINRLFFAHFETWALRGVGLGNSANYLGRVEGVELSVHNLWLGLWVEIGIVGLLLFLSMLRSTMMLVRNRTLAMILGTPLLVYSWTLGGLERSAILWFGLAMLLCVEVDKVKRPLLGWRLTIFPRRML